MKRLIIIETTVKGKTMVKCCKASKRAKATKKESKG